MTDSTVPDDRARRASAQGEGARSVAARHAQPRRGARSAAHRPAAVSVDGRVELGRRCRRHGPGGLVPNPLTIVAALFVIGARQLASPS